MEKKTRGKKRRKGEKGQKVKERWREEKRGSSQLKFLDTPLSSTAAVGGSIVWLSNGAACWQLMQHSLIVLQTAQRIVGLLYLCHCQSLTLCRCSSIRYLPHLADIASPASQIRGQVTEIFAAITLRLEV